jgi:hypothetical protein
MVAFESEFALGHVTVWESGEVEAEVVRLHPEERTLATSVSVAAVEDLDPVLGAVVAECSRP